MKVWQIQILKGAKDFGDLFTSKIDGEHKKIKIPFKTLTMHSESKPEKVGILASLKEKFKSILQIFKHNHNDGGAITDKETLDEVSKLTESFEKEYNTTTLPVYRYHGKHADKVIKSTDKEVQ